MAYEPIKNVLDLRFIGENIIEYIRTTNRNALRWANDDKPIDEFRAFYTNANGRRNTLFPSIMILTQAVETELAGEVLIAEYELVFEVVLSDKSADAVTTKAKIYQRAVESMLSNISNASLCENADPHMDGALLELESVFDLLARQTKPSAFIQVFNTRAKYGLTAPIT